MMAAGNPNWWSMMNGMHPLQTNSDQFVYGSNSNSNAPLIPSNPSPPDDHQDFPVRSWSQLLLGGLGSVGEEERYGTASLFQQQKKLDINWENQQELNLNPPSSFTRINNNLVVDDIVKQEVSQSTSSQLLYGHQLDQFHQDELIHPNSIIRSNCWTHHHNQVIPVSSPTSCVTTLSNNNFLNFSCAKAAATVEVNKSNHERHEDHISEGNSSRSTGGVSKKARVQQSSAQPALKVRKEKLGDRITALHQLVSPFGKTDTASVLSEAIGYIRFLQAQIEALSSPYMRNASGSTVSHQYSVQERNCLFAEELNQDSQLGRGAKDLRSRGLCLVPISCTQHVGNETGADYWASANLDGGGGF